MQCRICGNIINNQIGGSCSNLHNSLSWNTLGRYLPNQYLNGTYDGISNMTTIEYCKIMIEYYQNLLNTSTEESQEL